MRQIEPEPDGVPVVAGQALDLCLQLVASGHKASIATDGPTGRVVRMASRGRRYTPAVRARQARRVLRLDALLDVALGTVLLLSAWEGLYLTLGVPPPRPPVFGEMLGALLFGFAYLLWVAPDYAVLTRRVAEASALSNGGGAAVLVLWLISGPSGLGAVGRILVVLLAGVLGSFAYLEYRVATSP